MIKEKIVVLNGWAIGLNSTSLWGAYCPEVSREDRKELFVRKKVEGSYKITEITFSYNSSIDEIEEENSTETPSKENSPEKKEPKKLTLQENEPPESNTFPSSGGHSLSSANAIAKETSSVAEITPMREDER